MIFIIIFQIFINFFLTFFFSYYLSLFGIFFYSFFSFFFILIFIIYIYKTIIISNCLYLVSFDFLFLKINYFNLNWSFLIDSVNINMIFIIIFISFLVYLYSFSYMRKDPQLIRFLFLLNLFTFFMIILVTSNNYIQLFIGWEGVGLCSYFLINFWYTRLTANKSSLKAMLVNRIGDIFLLIAFGFIYLIFYSFDFQVIFSLINFYKYSYIYFFGYYFHSYTLISFFLVLGAFGKSAQLGLHTWLPDAMEGPTPVSALIHAATMVTAGVFLLIRSNFFFKYSSFVLLLIIFVGCLTALFGSLVACFQNDIKKIIAYSTCSQLGYMFVSCGFMYYDLSLFHLVNHAFFKALLFLSSGVIIHGLYDEQDIRKMGGLLKFFPLVYISFFVGSYALLGLPFLSGFYSKDLILETTLSVYTYFSFYIYLILIISAFFTSYYSIKLIKLVFFVKPNNSFISYSMLHFESIFVIFVLFFLNFFSIFSGFFFKDLFFGFGTNFFSTSIDYSISTRNILYSYEFLNFFIKLIPIFLFFFCLFIIFIFPYIFYRNISFFIYFYFFFNKKYYFDFIYNFYLNKKILFFAYDIFYKKLDKNFLELFGSTGLNFFFFKLSSFFNLIFSNYFNLYIIFLILNFLVYYLYLYFYLIDFFIFLFLYLFFFFLKKKN